MGRGVEAREMLFYFLSFPATLGLPGTWCWAIMCVCVGVCCDRKILELRENFLHIPLGISLSCWLCSKHNKDQGRIYYFSLKLRRLQNFVQIYSKWFKAVKSCVYGGFATSQSLTSSRSYSLGQIHWVTSEGPQLQFLPPSSPSSFLPSPLSKVNADRKVTAVITFWVLWR